MLRYVDRIYVTRTLNDIFGFDWDFAIDWQDIREDQVTVRGRLTVRTAGGSAIEKCQYGGAQIKFNKKSKKPVSIADDLKAAGSDALKKCATLLGIGLDLSEGQAKSGQLLAAQQGNGRIVSSRNGSKPSTPVTVTEDVRNLLRKNQINEDAVLVWLGEKYSRSFETLEDVPEAGLRRILERLKDDPASFVSEMMFVKR